MSKMEGKNGKVVGTETNVAGRKVIVKRAIDFITVLSCSAIVWYACTCKLLRLKHPLVI